MRFPMSLISVPIVLGAMLISFASSAETRPLSYSEFIKAVSAGRIESVEITGSHISGAYSNGDPHATFETYVPSVTGQFLDFLVKHGVTVVARSDPQPGRFSLILIASFGAIAVFILLRISTRVRRIERTLDQLASKQRDEPHS